MNEALQTLFRGSKEGRHANACLAQRNVTQHHLGHGLCTQKRQGIAPAVESSQNPLVRLSWNLAHMRSAVWSRSLDYLMCWRQSGGSYQRFMSEGTHSNLLPVQVFSTRAPLFSQPWNVLCM